MQGGRRPGAGRKSKESLLKRAFQDYFTEKEVKELMAAVKEQYKTKPEVMRMAVEQLFGKAPQRMELTGKDGEKLVVQVSVQAAERFNLHDSHPAPSPDNQGHA